MRLCRRCGRLQEDGRDTCVRDGADLTEYKPTLAVGQKVAGNYSIVAAIGVGQSGEVYEGRSEGEGGGRVIVRLLGTEVARDKRLSDVVRRHLLKQQEFEHKYVVRMRAVDRHDERILFVRDWVEGVRLEEVLAAEGALGVQRTLALATRICSALAEAHKVGLLHLQLRASNVFVVPSDEGEGESVRLVDFGVGPRCKVGPRPYYGAPKTLSPEQIEGKIVSFKSDIFAAGLLMYRMLAGQHAFDGPDDAVIKQICETPVAPIKYRPADPVPMELWAFIRQALEKKPIHRPIGMAQMADRLKELAGEAAAGRLSLEPPSPVDGRAAEQPADATGTGTVGERTPIGRIVLQKREAAGEPKPVAGEPKPVEQDGGEAIEVDVAVEEPQGSAAPPVPPGAGEAKGERAAEAKVPAAAKGADEGPAAEAGIAAGTAGAQAGEQEKEEPGAVAEKKARPGPPPPPPGPKADKSEAKEEIKPSSSTMPMEPEIIEEVAIPPPMKRSAAAPTAAAGTVEEVLAAAFRRGLFCGLGIGLAVAVVAFLVARFVGRPEAASAGRDGRPETMGRVGDAGSAGELRLTAEGPMQVSMVEDAGSGMTGENRTDAGVVAPPAVAEDVPPVAEGEEAGEAGPDGPTGSAAQEREDGGGTGAGGGSEDAGRRAEARAGTPEAVGEPAADAGRTAPPRSDAGRSGDGGGVSAEDLARANELVAQGDAALAARDFGAAQAAYQEALRLHPQNNRAKIGLGRTAFQQGNFAEAVRYLEPIYRNQGNLDLGVAYVRVGRLEDAKRQFERLLERNPNNTDAQRALEAVRRQLGE